VSLSAKEAKGLGELVTVVALGAWFLWRLRRRRDRPNTLAEVEARHAVLDGFGWIFLGVLGLLAAWEWWVVSVWIMVPLGALGCGTVLYGFFRLYKGVLKAFAATAEKWRDPAWERSRAARRQHEREEEEMQRLTPRPPLG